MSDSESPNLPSNLISRLRDAHPHSAQLANGSMILAEAADEIARLSQEREEFKTWWERDSKGLGTALGELATLRAVKEDQRAEIERLTESYVRETHWARGEIERLTRELHGMTAARDAFKVACDDKLDEIERLTRERDEYARCLDGGTDCAGEKLRLRAALGIMGESDGVTCWQHAGREPDESDEKLTTEQKLHRLAVGKT